MPKFLAQGGLGNQLFILSEAINISRENQTCAKICMPNKSQDSILALKNQIGNVDIAKSIKEHKLLKCANFLNFRFSEAEIAKFVNSKIRIVESVNMSVSSELRPMQSDNRLIVGLFQNHSIVQNAWSTLKKALEWKFDLTEANVRKVIKFKKYSILHVRRGDYVQNSEHYGLLSLQYYQEALRYLNYSPIITTDDLAFAERIKAEFRTVQVIGPDELNSWETLCAMSVADELVTANSSLSWWASYFLTSENRTAFLPKPWFRKHNSDSPLVYFPGARLIDAKYEI